MSILKPTDKPVMVIETKYSPVHTYSSKPGKNKPWIKFFMHESQSGYSANGNKRPVSKSDCYIIHYAPKVRLRLQVHLCPNGVCPYVYTLQWYEDKLAMVTAIAALECML